MTQLQRILTVATQGQGLYRITSEVAGIVQAAGVQTGVCTLFLRHTSASLLIQENADPDVLLDLETYFSQLVPEKGIAYRHCAEGPDDMPGHIRTSLTHTSEQIPIHGGQLLLGTWQGIYVWEHRRRGSQRQVVVHVAGE